MIAYNRVVDAFRREGLNVKENGHGKATAQAPGHSAADASVSITYIGDRVLVWSHSDPTDQVLSALNLTMQDLFDDPRGTSYRYDDGRFVHRSPDKKFRQSGNTKGTSLYRADRLADADVVWLVEGEQDVHALESEGVAATCTAMGAGKAHLFDLTPLHGKTVRIVRDMDEPGRAHAQQLVELLDGKATVSVWEPAAGKDAADHVAADFGIDDFRPAQGFTANPLLAALRRITEAAEAMPFDDAVGVAYQELDALTASDDTPDRVPVDQVFDEWWKWLEAPTASIRTILTPWPELDDVLSGGLHPGRSYLIAGRPGGGKSLALTNIAAYAAERGSRGLLFSLEMGRIEIASRIIAAGAKAEYGQITRRQVDAFNLARVAAYLDQARGMPLWVCDQATITVDHVRAQARSLKRSHGLDFVAVDYAQLMRPTNSRETRERQIAEISRNLKILAKDLDVAVVTACQLNRAPAKEKRPPTIAELRESGALEQDSDVIILLHHNTHEGGLPTGDVDMIVGKNRTGKLSTITLPWRAYQARIGG